MKEVLLIVAIAVVAFAALFCTSTANAGQHSAVAVTSGNCGSQGGTLRRATICERVEARRAIRQSRRSCGSQGGTVVIHGKSGW